MPRHPEDAMMTIDELHKQGSEEEELGVCLCVHRVYVVHECIYLHVAWCV